MSGYISRPTRKTREKRGGVEKEPIEARLLTAMERLLGRGHRFATLTVDQLASEAGISRGTFYLHFQDKADLVSRLMSVVTDDIVRSAGTWLALSDSPKRADIAGAIFGTAAAFQQHRAIIAALRII